MEKTENQTTSTSSNDSNNLKVWNVGGVTMVGYRSSNFPLKGGNCFSLCTKRYRKSFRIVNFGYENFDELLKRKILTWPVTIQTLSDRHAILIDERIPEDWYSEFYCTICCPKEFFRQKDLDEFNRRYIEIRDEVGKVLYLRWRNPDEEVK